MMEEKNRMLDESLSMVQSVVQIKIVALKVFATAAATPGRSCLASVWRAPPLFGFIGAAHRYERTEGCVRRSLRVLDQPRNGRRDEEGFSRRPRCNER